MERSYLDSTWLNIGSREQFFFDDLMLELIQDVTRRYHVTLHRFFEKLRKKTGAIALEVVHNGEWMIKMQLSLLNRSRLIGFSDESVS